MIFTIPLTIIYFTIVGLISLLPNAVSLPYAFTSGFQYLFGYLYAFDFMLSVQLVITLLSLSLAFELAIQVWHGFHWLLSKIPFLHVR